MAGKIMLCISRLFLVLLVLTLLPWSSLAQGLNAPPLHIVSDSPRLDPQSHSPTTSSAQPHKTYVAAIKRCKGPILRGTPCDPVLAVLPAEMEIAFASRATLLQSLRWSRLKGHHPPQSIGPPRRV
ncbi:hypothetical protein [Cypionkella sp.]|uniref:hypothetical protein n=1 Tax=Cypionkella sp. TaxID=2811411 RepID=UPI0026299B73|nr:hypothetical protein [Cypionkella sp.]